MKTDNNINSNLQDELELLKNLKDTDINLSDIPEIDFTSNTIYQGKFYKPVKQSVTLRLDADVVAWFKQHYPKYQSGINSALRAYVMKHN